jgi:hypothetical protein
MKFVVKPSKEEQYAADNPLLGKRKRNLNGQTEEYTALLRDPVTPAERRMVRELWKDNIATVRKALTKKDCPRCHGKGTYDVTDYPGHPLYHKLVSSEECDCIWED